MKDSLYKTIIKYDKQIVKKLQDFNIIQQELYESYYLSHVNSRYEVVVDTIKGDIKVIIKKDDMHDLNDTYENVSSNTYKDSHRNRLHLAIDLMINCLKKEGIKCT